MLQKVMGTGVRIKQHGRVLRWVGSPVGAKYGHGLNRLSQAVLAFLARVYKDVPPPPPSLTTKERNEISRKKHAERNARIRSAAGEALREIAKREGISVARVHQIVHGKRK